MEDGGTAQLTIATLSLESNNKNSWTHRELNPGLSGGAADVMPLPNVPSCGILISNLSEGLSLCHICLMTFLIDDKIGHHIQSAVV
jgi:hypothetical protein